MRNRPATAVLLGWIAACGVFGAGLPRTARAQTSTAASVTVVPLAQQYSLDCEAAALQMALRAVGITASQDSLITSMGADLRPPVSDGSGPVRWDDPYQTFVGDVRGHWLTTGYGAYYPPITAAARAAGATALGQQGWQPAQLYAEIAAGHPVVVLVPHLMHAEQINHWTTWDGRSIWYSPQDHAQVLIADDPAAATVTLADPLDGQVHTFPMALFETRFAGFGGQGVAVAPPDGAASVSTSPSGNQVLFWKGGDNGLWEAWSSGSGWTPGVEVTGASMASAPAAAVTNSGQQIVFWEGTDGLLHEIWWQAGQWNGPVEVGGGWVIDSRPSVFVTPDQTQVLVWRSAGGTLSSAWFQSGAWHGPVAVPAVSGMLSAPAAINAGNDDQAVFWQGSDGHLAEAWWTAADFRWHGPVEAAGGVALGSGPAAALTVDDQQMVVWRGSGGELCEIWWDHQTGWNGPVRYGFASLASAPSVDTDARGAQHVFWKGVNGNAWLSTWTRPSGWSSPADVGVGPLR